MFLDTDHFSTLKKENAPMVEGEVYGHRLSIWDVEGSLGLETSNFSSIFDLGIGDSHSTGPTHCTYWFYSSKTS